MVSPKAYPLFNPSVTAAFGGAEVDLYYLGTELAKDPGFEVSFVTADYGQPAIERCHGVTIRRSLRFGTSTLSGARRVWNAMKQADADMYMIKSISGGLYLTALFCRLHQRQFIYRTAHSTHCDGTYLKRHPIMGKLFVRSVQKADAVFVQNESDRLDLKRTCGIEAVAVPNGHRLQPMSNVPRDMILWVGRSADFKHPERFIRLARTFAKEHFVMICQRATADRIFDDLRLQAAQIENLTFIDHVPFDQIDAWFQRARVFVNTSDFEGFPNTFIQACKAGTAILSFAVNPDGFLDEHRCGICAGGSEQRLDDGLKYLLTDDHAAELGRNGRQYVAQTHAIETIVETYKTYFRNLMNDGRKSR